MRPNTEIYDKLEHGVRFRLTNLEKRILLRRCEEEGYRTISDFCRAKLVKKREFKKIVVSQEFIVITKKMDSELNRIGINLNQLTKAINSNQVYQFSQADREVIQELWKSLQKCFSILEHYLNQIENH